MQLFIVLSAVVALAVARPGFLHAPAAYSAYSTPFAYAAPVAYAAAVPVEISSQYHAQDSLGQYNYGYADALSSKAETKSFDGVTRGAYSYVDAEGKIQKVEYTADAEHGFRVEASNLPVAPEVPAVEAVEAPKPVEDTPEVAKAKEEHFIAIKEAKALQAATPAEIVAPVAYGYAAPYAAYAHPAVHAYSHAYAHHPYSYYPYNAAYGYHY